jgi:Catalase
VPGIGFSPDKMLQARLFSYGDTQGSTALSDSVVLIAGMWKVDRTLDGKTTVGGPLRVSAVLQKRMIAGWSYSSTTRRVLLRQHPSPLPLNDPAALGPTDKPAEGQ